MTSRGKKKKIIEDVNTMLTYRHAVRLRSNQSNRSDIFPQRKYIFSIFKEHNAFCIGCMKDFPRFECANGCQIIFVRVRTFFFKLGQRRFRKETNLNNIISKSILSNRPNENLVRRIADTVASRNLTSTLPALIWSMEFRKKKNGQSIYLFFQGSQ